MPAERPSRSSTRPTGAHHHGSHNHLLHQVMPERLGRVDAIVVPTARPAPYLSTAIALAQELDCTLLALCSKYARAQDVLVEAGGIDNVVAVDVPATVDLRRFATSRLLAGTKFDRATDTSTKRNLGLAVAWMAGWERIVFLDDDMQVSGGEQVRLAASGLGSYNAVGLENTGFPDNSVVCHAFRAVGGRQDSFIGGGALAVLVDRDRIPAFFPNIYNEDWFFLLDDAGITPVAVAGRVDQKPFDPYANPRRARSEELGDCLAEGLYALLDDNTWVRHADELFWKHFLHDRGQLIEWVLDRIPNLARRPDERDRMAAALRAARARSIQITPELCTQYLDAWRADRRTWRRYLRSLQRRDVRAALARLGLQRAVAEPRRYRVRPKAPRRQAPMWTMATPLPTAEATSWLAVRARTRLTGPG